MISSTRCNVFYICGDSTTVVVKKDTVVHVDVQHVDDAADDDPRVPIVDRLVELLPKKNGKLLGL